MQRDLVLSLSLLLFFFVMCGAKICPSIDVRSRPEQFEKLRNCTVIMGDLKIVLFENVKNDSGYDQYTFPELTEISDFLIVFNVVHLKSLGSLFPNLRVIRGYNLFLGYSLILYHVVHVEEIGLTSLRYIRGGVKIDYCPNLCFADTINWQAIGASVVDYRKTTSLQTCANKYCPNECRGYCWNTLQCQKFPDVDHCHPQCIGCSQKNSSKHCDSCKFYENDGECVQTCPKSKVANDHSMRCMTRNDCKHLLNRTYWIFQDKCVNTCPIFYERIDSNEGCKYVGDNYKKYCNGTVVDTIDTLKAMQPCTHINGSLDIRLGDYAEQQLETSLGSIVSISGYLKIGRSSAITSLEFLKKLREIRGETLENKKYALFVFENPNLQRLWNFDDGFDLKIKRGTIAFHDNPQLCFSEITQLANETGINKADLDLFKYSNGYQAACNIKDIHIEIVEKNPTNITLAWKNLDLGTNETIIGYTVYYVKASTNITSFQNKDACNAESWDSILVTSTTVQLKYLVPYTRYGYYIKVMDSGSEMQKDGLRGGQQTPVYYFNTSSFDPSEPIDLIAEAKNESTIILRWKPPRLLNGKLSHYNITMYLQEDYTPMIQERDYCLYPHVTSGEQVFIPKKDKNKDELDNCPCLIKEKYQFFNKDKICVNDDCKKFLYYSEEEKSDNVNIQTTIQKRTAIEEVIKIDKINKVYRQIIKKDVDVDSYEITNLRHFSVYIFFLIACNEREGERDQCSGPEMVSQRTKKKEDADNVKTFHISVDNKDVYVKWSEPEEINSVIVSYHIEHKRVDLDDAKPITECISKKLDVTMNKYQLIGLSPGKYAMRVRATSLAGPGKFSAWKKFEIVPPNAGLYWVYSLVSIVGLMVIALTTYVTWYWWRRKYSLDSNHLITSVNPDYAGPIYEEDEWEIDRNDIEILKELGQGSFGMVYRGRIKSKNYPCAIKTVNDSLAMSSRMEFLNEGAVMKAFNDAHHVIKLLGIVSRGQPPLVIMELMERGDLKKYLHRCREPSQNLTTNEIYRMAAEIADGMAYLAAKKFVHRDLAARNCMVAADRTVKIGDFGMARDVYETDYYRKETVGLLPVRWMAPESLADGVFTSDSDVWSYGIVLWEMATLAEQPYQGLSNEEVFHFVKNKGRLERPPECSDLLYEVMDACWLWRPNDRPTFADIVDKLVGHVGEDFRLVAFCYSRQGRELALNAGPRVYNPPAMIVVPEEDYFSRYDASEEEVSLYMKEPNRPTKFLPSSQRFNNMPYQISPGSPSSTFSLDSS